MDEAKYQELIEWAVGTLEKSKGTFTIYNSDREDAEKFALSMLKKIEEINSRGGKLRNYSGEPYDTTNFPYSVEVIDYKEDLRIAEKQDLCMIVLDPEGKIGKEGKGIDLGFFINNSHQAA